MIFLFRKIEITDKALFDQFQMKDYEASELNFVNIYAWKNQDQLEFFHDDDMLIIKGKDFFFPPLVKGDAFNKAIKFIKDYCDNNQFVFNIVGITPELLPFFNLPNTKIYPHNELNEYLYHPEDLITYKGKKYHSKRNLVNQFENDYDFKFVSYDPSLRDGIVKLIDEWTEHKSLTYEKEGILSLLDNRDALGCFCDCLIIDDAVQAFAIGTITNDIGIVLFEKANTNYIGIYAAIVTYFARQHFANVKFINRQEDMGIENLRISKMSYNPCGFAYKYQLTLTDEAQLVNLYHLSFHDSLAYENYFFTQKTKQIKILKLNNIITSALYYRDETMIINNQEIKVAFIFGLATHPLYRHQGYMRTLLEKTLQELALDHTLVYLHPDVKNFYEQFGFVYFNSVKALEKPLDEPVNKLSVNKLSDVQDIYNNVALGCDGYIVRDEKRWHDLLEEIKLDGGNIYLFNQVYQVHDGQDIIESIGSNLTTIQEKMLRIVNLPALLKALKLDLTTNYQIVDKIITSNNIIVNDKENPITVDINEFSSILFKKLIILALDKY